MNCEHVLKYLTDPNFKEQGRTYFKTFYSLKVSHDACIRVHASYQLEQESKNKNIYKILQVLEDEIKVVIHCLKIEITILQNENIFTIHKIRKTNIIFVFAYI